MQELSIIDPEYVLSQLGLATALSFFVERALAVAFGTRVFITRLSRKSLKEPIAVALALGVCLHWKVDVVTALVEGRNSEAGFLGMLLTAGIVAGGSKASLKLFRDLLGLMSTAEQEQLGAPPKAPEQQQLAAPPKAPGGPLPPVPT
jgi:hypothetical protein